MHRRRLLDAVVVGEGRVAVDEDLAALFDHLGPLDHFDFWMELGTPRALDAVRRIQHLESSLEGDRPREPT